MQEILKGKKGKAFLSDEVIMAARSGDIVAISLLQKFLDPYIRKLSTLCVRGTHYLDTELYENIKTRMTIETLKFEPGNFEDSKNPIDNDKVIKA